MLYIRGDFSSRWRARDGRDIIIVLFPSSSFIKPPANGHHRWSGAGKTHFNNFLQFFLQYWRGLFQTRQNETKKKSRKYDDVG
jgi:hypothetical protein